MKERTILPVRFLVPTILVAIFGLPLVAAALPVLEAQNVAMKVCALVLAPAVFSLLFVGFTGLLSMSFQGAILPGKFPRVLTHVVYGPRRLYGLCWCAVFYFTPIYYAFLSVSTLRKIMLWAFGYRGHSDVNLAPDAWIRDLPLLKLDEGAYAANKSTLGTNICLATGQVLVDHVTLGKRALIGHLAMLAPGSKVGDRGEIGVGVAFGIRASIGERTRVGPTVTINHGADIGSKVDVGTYAYVGIKAKIADGIRIPSATVIPDGAEIKSAEDVKQHADSIKRGLEEERTRIAQHYAARVQEG